MAKDPAFLWYPNDYIGGTMGMTFEEKGAYIELLMMQFNRGHMTTHMVGQIVGQLWDNIMVKFTQDANGLWYNERLDEEQLKRKRFTESRRNNVSGKNQHSKKPKKERGHTTSHMEDVNENENVSKNENVILPFDSPKFLEYWGYWKEYKKKEHRFSYKSLVSEQASAKQLAELSNGEESSALKIIEKSIANGWKGFFPLDKAASNQGGMDAYKAEQIRRANA